MKTRILFFLALLVFSCKEEIEDMEPAPDATPALEWKTGRNDYNIEMNGDVRNFVINVPVSYDGSTAVPLVLMLHGSSGTGERFYNISRWAEKGEAENFIAVFPTALEYRLIDGKRSTKWSSAGLVNEVPEGTVIKDDIPFLEELIDLCKKTFAIDGRRVYISGFSNGGGFVKSEVVPRMGEIIAAANATGGVGIPVIAPIQGNRNMPLFNISGTMDDRIWEAAGEPKELPIKAEDIEDHDLLWSGLKNMCSMLGLDTTYREQPQVPQYNLMIFDQKLESQASEYLFMMVKGLEHRYPNGGNNPQGVVAVDVLWPWFQKFSL